MPIRIATCIARYPWYWLLLWIVIVAILRFASPRWDDVSRDGDLAFFAVDDAESNRSENAGASISRIKGKSRIAIVMAREERGIDNADLAVALDVGRRLTQIVAAAQSKHSSEESLRDVVHRDLIRALCDTSVQMDNNWFEAIKTVAPDNKELLENRWISSYKTRSDYLNRIAKYDPEFEKTSANDVELATILESAQRDQPTEQVGPTASTQTLPAGNVELTDDDVKVWGNVLDVWSWEDAVLGIKLGSNHPKARMIVLQLNSEFMAVGNIRLVEKIEALINDVRKLHRDVVDDSFSIGISGDSAVGADMLRAASSERPSDGVGEYGNCHRHSDLDLSIGGVDSRADYNDPCNAVGNFVSAFRLGSLEI